MNLETLEWTSPEASHSDRLTFQCHKNQQCQRDWCRSPEPCWRFVGAHYPWIPGTPRETDCPMPKFRTPWETHSEDPSSPATINHWNLKLPSHSHMPQKDCFTFWVGQKGGNFRDLKEKDGVDNVLGLRFQGPTLQTESAIDEGWVKIWNTDRRIRQRPV